MTDRNTTLARIREQSHFALLVDVGTTARPVTAWMADFCRHYGIDLEAGQHVRAIQFDAQREAAAAQTPWLDGPGDAASPSWLTFIEAQLPDADSLRAMEQDGRFYFAHPDWAEKDGQAKEAAGTGGNPRRARALFECLKIQIDKALTDQMRAFLDYERQQDRLLGPGREPDGAVLPIILTYSTLGGFGPGVRHALTRLIADVANRLGVNVKLVSIALCHATIEPVNPQQAAMNEESYLSYAQADLVADLDYTAAERPARMYLPESTLLITNQNRHGEIPTLARLQGVVGFFLFHSVFTPVGRLLMERMVDIEDANRTDEYGGPCNLSTVGLSAIHLDAGKLGGYLGCRAMGRLCEKLLSPPDQRSVRQAVLQIARNHALLETSDEPLASTRVASLAAFGGEDVFSRLHTVFFSRLAGLTGFPLCREQARAYRFCTLTELPQNVMPAVAEEARGLLAAALETVRADLTAFLACPEGPQRARSYLLCLAAIIEKSTQDNAETSRALAESLRPILETLTDTEEQIETLERRNRVVRAFRPFTIRRLQRTYASAAETALRAQAEMELRTALARELFRPLLATLGKEQARINGLVSRLEALRDSAVTGSQRMTGLPADRLVPVGLELATPEFLSTQAIHLVNQLGGEEALVGRLFQELLARFGSLDQLVEQDLETTEKSLVTLCQAPFERFVRDLDVLGVFQEQFPDPAKQRQMLEQLVHEAAGRLAVTGEAGRPISWIKIVGVGTVAGTDWLAIRLREADREPGEWLMCEHGDRYTVVLLMYRSGISFDGIMRNVRRRRSLIGAKPPTLESGPDPIVPLLPSVRPSETELSLTIVRGLSAGAVRRNNGGFAWTDPADGELDPGSEPREARRVLARDYPTRVRLTVEFMRALTHRRNELLSRLQAVRTALVDNKDGLAELIDEAAVWAVEAEAAGLWPYLRRVSPGRR